MFVIALVAMVMGHQGGGPSEKQSPEQSPELLSAMFVTVSAFIRELGRGTELGVGAGAASVLSEETAAGFPS
jgi:hypothetical protein